MSSGQSQQPPHGLTHRAPDLSLDDDTVSRLLSQLADVAGQTVRAIIVQVPAYADALAGPMGRKITTAVEVALHGFLDLASNSNPTDAGAPTTPARDGAYDLGRGEAQSGRTMDALLAAYRVGAREAWRQFSRTAVDAGLSSEEMAKFAELIFAYIDELSAASAAGHADQLATTGRVRARYLSRLTLAVLGGAATDQLVDHARRADWDPPTTLSAVLLATDFASRAAANLHDEPLRADEEVPDLEEQEQTATTVLLVANADGVRRSAVARSLSGYGAVYLGPPKPWTQARASYLRALRAQRLALSTGDGVCDTEDHLPALVVAADVTALADLRASVLAPLTDLRAASADRLTETLRAWLLHQGRREQVAAALHVHPQTVRYRVNQLRERFGDRLDDPETVAALTIALAHPPTQRRAAGA